MCARLFALTNLFSFLFECEQSSRSKRYNFNILVIRYTWGNCTGMLWRTNSERDVKTVFLSFSFLFSFYFIFFRHGRCLGELHTTQSTLITRQSLCPTRHFIDLLANMLALTKFEMSGRVFFAPKLFFLPIKPNSSNALFLLLSTVARFQEKISYKKSSSKYKQRQKKIQCFLSFFAGD